MNTLSLVPHLEAGKNLVAAFLEIPEKFRPTKVNQFRRALCLDKETRAFYVANPYAKLIVLADQFPPAELLAFARRNNL
jgi:hypothetical protein